MESNTILYCNHCFVVNGIKVPLKLKIIETTEWDAEFIRSPIDTVDDATKQVIPTFEVETGNGEVEWEPKFVCPVCHSPAYFLNRNISYDEDNDLLYVNDQDEAELLGYRAKAPPKELPKIQRPSQVCPSS